MLFKVTEYSFEAVVVDVAVVEPGDVDVREEEAGRLHPGVRDDRGRLQLRAVLCRLDDQKHDRASANIWRKYGKDDTI